MYRLNVLVAVVAVLAWWSASSRVQAAETEYLLGFCTDEEHRNAPPKCALRDRVAPPASMLGKEGDHYRNEVERCATSPCPDADAAMRRVIAVEKELRDAVDSIHTQLGDDDPWYQRVADEARQAIRDARAEQPRPKTTDEETSFIDQLDGFTSVALRDLRKAEEAEKQCAPESTCPEATALVDRLPALRSQLSRSSSRSSPATGTRTPPSRRSFCAPWPTLTTARASSSGA